jgi:hypothetical protein
MLIVYRKNLSQSECTDCKIITIEKEKKVFWCGALIVVNVLKFNRNWVDRPTICQSVRMGRLYSQDSKPRSHKEQMPY